MVFNRYKDLEKGDRVKYENAAVGAGRKKSGEGRVFGFDKFAGKVFVWVRDDKGELQSVPCEEVKKL